MGEKARSRQTAAETVPTVPPPRSSEEITMFVPEPFIRFESRSVTPVSVPAGLHSLAAVFAVALVLFVVMLSATPGITRICPAPRVGTPVHLAR
jgi:hypothetical protein